MGKRGKCLKQKLSLQKKKGENLSHLEKDPGRLGTFLPSAGELSQKKPKKQSPPFKVVLELHSSFCLHLWLNKYHLPSVQMVGE